MAGTESLESLLRQVIHWSEGVSLILALDCRCRDELIQCDLCHCPTCDTCMERCDSCYEKLCLGCVLQCPSCRANFCKLNLICAALVKCDYCSALSCIECRDVCEMCNCGGCQDCSKQEFRVVHKSWRQCATALCRHCESLRLILKS